MSNVNKNWAHNRPIVSSVPGKFAYLSPIIREVCIQCKEVNVYIMRLLESMEDTAIKDTTLAELNAYHPDILRRVVYDQEIYNKIITALPSLCEHYKREGKCNVDGCNYNPSTEN